MRYVDDFKSGYHFDSEPERHAYAYAAHLLHPDEDTIVFRYLNATEQSVVVWTYHWKSERTIEITSPDGETTKLVGRGEDPLFGYLRKRRQAILDMEPIPTPGPHCEHWYGEPCQFAGSDCPLATYMPVIQSWSQSPAVRAAEIENLPPERAVGTVAMALLKDVELRPTPLLGSYALQGVEQLRGAADKISRTLRSWCHRGLTFQHGNEEYGIYTTDQVDQLAALQALLANCELEDVARVVSIYPNKLRKLSKRKYGDLGEEIFEATSIPGTRKQFGKIMRKQNNE